MHSSKIKHRIKYWFPVSFQIQTDFLQSTREYFPKFRNFIFFNVKKSHTVWRKLFLLENLLRSLLVKTLVVVIKLLEVFEVSFLYLIPLENNNEQQTNRAFVTKLAFINKRIIIIFFWFHRLPRAMFNKIPCLWLELSLLE